MVAMQGLLRVSSVRTAPAAGRHHLPVCCSGRASFSGLSQTPPVDPFRRFPSRPVSQPARQSSARRDATSRAAAASGGGSSDGAGGGSGGGGDGDGFSGGSSGAGGWDARRIWTLIYALSLIAGGAYAYLKKGSRPSLIASSAVGTCLLAAVWQMGVHQQAGMGIALVTSMALTAAMGNRYRKSRKFMPSGMVALVSLVSAAWYANWPQ